MTGAGLFNRLWRGFLQGMALIAPVLITLAFLFWLGGTLEAFMGEVLRRVLPTGWYIPGTGLALGLGMTLAVGLLANVFLVRWLVRLTEHVLDRIPLVQSLYQGIKDISRLFLGDTRSELGRVVTVQLGEVRLVGFVTQEEAVLPSERVDNTDLMAVYLPMSYQIGGYTMYVNKRHVTPLDVPATDAMRAVITGGALKARRWPRTTPQSHPDATA